MPGKENVAGKPACPVSNMLKAANLICIELTAGLLVRSSPWLRLKRLDLIWFNRD
jgi:hypothetical protein